MVSLLQFYTSDREIWSGVSYQGPNKTVCYTNSDRWKQHSSLRIILSFPVSRAQYLVRLEFATERISRTLSSALPWAAMQGYRGIAVCSLDPSGFRKDQVSNAVYCAITQTFLLKTSKLKYHCYFNHSQTRLAVLTTEMPSCFAAMVTDF